MRPEICVEPTAGRAAEVAARLFAEIAQRAADQRSRFLVALSGGSSPLPLYALLAEREDVPWLHTYVFWGDERCVPPGHPESNFGAAREVLLSQVPVPDAQVHRMRGEEAPDAEATRYERLLRDTAPGEPPRLDLILLGMGADGHVASLFPGSGALEESKRLVLAVDPPRADGHRRITLTLPVINAARNVLFLVTGMGKAAVAASVLEGSGLNVPAARIRPEDGRLFWLLDEAAASQLSDSVRRAARREQGTQTGREG